MKYRSLGKTGYRVSEIGYGSWSLGAGWGTVTDDQANAALECLNNTGVNFIDTADIYGNGRSERLIGNYLQKTKNATFVATKIGRYSNPHTAESYTKNAIFSYVNQCRINLKTNCLDLLQLHTPPTQVYYMPEIFLFLDELVKRKIIRHYGVSVEKVEEGLKAIEFPNVATVQIIFNIFRQRPMESFFLEAQKRNIGIIVRVPLASGLLSGKFNIFSRFPKNDHRNFNRHGEVFDQGETFAGVDFKSGLIAVNKLKHIKPMKYSMVQFALRWILMQNAVSTVIVGGKTPKQILENCSAGDLPILSRETMARVHDLYTHDIMPQVHYRW